MRIKKEAEEAEIQKMKAIQREKVRWWRVEQHIVTEGLVRAWFPSRPTPQPNALNSHSNTRRYVVFLLPR